MNKHSQFGTFPIQVPMELAQTVFPTLIGQVGDHKDFVQEEPLDLRCLTKIWANCVVVDVSIYLGTLTWEVSVILESPPFFVRVGICVEPPLCRGTSQGKYWIDLETWHVDDNCSRDTKMCNPEPCSSSATRVRVMKCDLAVQLCTVLYLWMYCSHPPVGWLEVFLQATETSPNSEKNFTNRQGLKNAENFNCSSSNGFGSNLTTMTKLSAGFSAALCRTYNLFWVKRIVVFFDAFELLSFSLSYLLTARNGSFFFLGPCQVLFGQSFAFSFRLSKVRSLIEWLLESFVQHGRVVSQVYVCALHRIWCKCGVQQQSRVMSFLCMGRCGASRWRKAFTSQP